MPCFTSGASDVAYELTRGDTSDFVYVRPSYLDGAVIDGNWSCVGTVIDRNGDVVVDEYSITEKSADNTEFKAYLTPTQTVGIPPTNAFKEYTWVIRVTNSTLSPVVSRAINLRLLVSPTAWP